MSDSNCLAYLRLECNRDGATCTGHRVLASDLPIWVSSGIRTMLQAMRQDLILRGASEAEATEHTLNAARLAVSDFVFNPDPECGRGICREVESDDTDKR